MAINVSKAIRKALVDAWHATGLEDATIRLFIDDISADPNRPIGDFTEPTFTGYAAKDAAVLGESTIEGDQVILPLDPVGFQASAVLVDSVTCYGWFLKSGAGALQACERFSEPAVFLNDGSYKLVNAVMKF